MQKRDFLDGFRVYKVKVFQMSNNGTYKRRGGTRPRAGKIYHLEMKPTMFRSTTNKIRHSYLAFGADTRKVEEDGRVSWTHPLNTRDGWALPNGNYLLTITRQNGWPSGGVMEVDPKGNKVVWEHKGTQSEVNTSQRCANGNTLLVEAGANPRLLEVSPSGKVEVEIALKAQTRDHHMQSRMSRKLANGNYLVPYLFDTCVREFAPDGRIVWEAKTPNWAFSALRMKNGNTLVSCTYGNIDVEFDKSGKKVWQITNDDLPGAPFKDCCGAQLLPNGNIVQTAYGASGIAVKLVEFNKNKEVLWATSDGLGHGIHHFQILTTNGVALPLDAVK